MDNKCCVAQLRYICTSAIYEAAFIRMSHVTYMNESCDIYGWVM